MKFQEYLEASQRPAKTHLTLKSKEEGNFSFCNISQKDFGNRIELEGSIYFKTFSHGWSQVEVDSLGRKIVEFIEEEIEKENK